MPLADRPQTSGGPWLPVLRDADEHKRKAKAGLSLTTQTSANNITVDSAATPHISSTHSAGLMRSQTAASLRRPPLHPLTTAHDSAVITVNSHSMTNVLRISPSAVQTTTFDAPESPVASSDEARGSPTHHSSKHSDIAVAERVALPGAHLAYGCIVCLQSLASGGFLEMLVDTARDGQWDETELSSEMDGTVTWCEATGGNPLVELLCGKRRLSPKSKRRTLRRGSVTAMPLAERVARGSFFRVLNADNSMDRSDVKAGDNIALEVLLYDGFSTHWVVGARVLLNHQTDPRFSRRNMLLAMSQTPFNTAEEHMQDVIAEMPRDSGELEGIRSKRHSLQAHSGTTSSVKKVQAAGEASHALGFHHSSAMWKAAAVPLLSFEGMVGDLTLPSKQQRLDSSPAKRAAIANSIKMPGAATNTQPVPYALKVYESKKKMKLSEMATKNTADPTTASKRLGAWKVRLHSAAEVTSVLAAVGSSNSSSSVSAQDVLDGYSRMVNLKGSKSKQLLTNKGADDDDGKDDLPALLGDAHAGDGVVDIGHLAVISFHMDWGHLAVEKSAINSKQPQESSSGDGALHHDKMSTATYEVVVRADPHESKGGWEKDGDEGNNNLDASDHGFTFPSTTVALSAAVIDPLLVSRKSDGLALGADDDNDDEGISAERKDLIREHLKAQRDAAKAGIDTFEDTTTPFMTDPSIMPNERRRVELAEVEDVLAKVKATTRMEEAQSREPDAAKHFLQRVQTPSALLRKTGRAAMFDIPRVGLKGLWRVWLCAPSLAAFTRMFEDTGASQHHKTADRRTSLSSDAASARDSVQEKSVRDTESSIMFDATPTPTAVPPATAGPTQTRHVQSDVQRYNHLLDRATRQLRSQSSDRAVSRNKNVTGLVTASIQQNKRAGTAQVEAFAAERSMRGVASVTQLPWWTDTSDFATGVLSPTANSNNTATGTRPQSPILHPSMTTSSVLPQAYNNGTTAPPATSKAPSPQGTISRSNNNSNKHKHTESDAVHTLQRAEAEAAAQALEATVPTAFWMNVLTQNGLSSMISSLDAERQLHNVLNVLENSRAMTAGKRTSFTTPAAASSSSSAVDVKRLGGAGKNISAVFVIKALRAFQRRWRVKKHMNMKWQNALCFADLRIARIIATGVDSVTDMDAAARKERTKSVITPVKDEDDNYLLSPVGSTAFTFDDSASVSKPPMHASSHRDVLPLMTPTTGRSFTVDVHGSRVESQTSLVSKKSSEAITLQLKKSTFSSSSSLSSHHASGTNTSRLLSYLDQSVRARIQPMQHLREQFVNNSKEGVAAPKSRINSGTNRPRTTTATTRRTTSPLLATATASAAAVSANTQPSSPSETTQIASRSRSRSGSTSAHSSAVKPRLHSAMTAASSAVAVKPRLHSAMTAASSSHRSLHSLSQLPVDTSSAPRQTDRLPPAVKLAYEAAFTPTNTAATLTGSRHGTAVKRGSFFTAGAPVPHHQHAEMGEGDDDVTSLVARGGGIAALSVLRKYHHKVGSSSTSSLMGGAAPAGSMLEHALRTLAAQDSEQTASR